MKCFKYVIGVCSLLLFVSCGVTGKFYKTESKITDTSVLRSFDLEEIDNPFPENRDYVDFTSSLKYELISELEKQGFVVDTEAPNFKIDIEVMYVNEGDQALRFLVGLGAGKGEVKTIFHVKDTNDKLLLDGVGEGKIISWTASLSDVATYLAKDFVKQLNSRTFKSRY